MLRTDEVHFVGEPTVPARSSCRPPCCRHRQLEQPAERRDDAADTATLLRVEHRKLTVEKMPATITSERRRTPRRRRRRGRWLVQHLHRFGVEE
jgi:hypothetical protein